MPPSLDMAVLRTGCPKTVGYILFWAHAWWALGVALSGRPAFVLYTNLPHVDLHLWDALALCVAVLLRVGLTQLRAGRGARVLQIGAAAGLVLWAWADVAFMITLGPSSAFVYTGLAGTAAWLVYLTGDAWVTPA